MNRTGGASRREHTVLSENTRVAAACPTCGTMLTQERYDSILRIDEARREEIAGERATLERERAAIIQERTNIAAEAVAAERSKWEAEVSRVQRDGDRQKKLAEANLERLARAHRQELQAELRKRDAQEKHLARQVAVAKAESDGRVRQATRILKEHQRATIDELRGQLKTLDQRRRRDEDAWKQTVANLQRKAEDRDRAHFGPEGEEDLVRALRAQFSGDRIEHRGTGGDALQTVVDAGRDVARILYENKNTASWQRAYLRQTQRAMELHGTSYGVIVTRTLPRKAIGMCVLSGVIIVVPAIAAQVAAVLRDGILSISRLRLSEHGKSAKTTALFDYLRGNEFRACIQRVFQKLVELKENLHRERSHHDGWWASRENDYATILRATAGIDARVSELLGSATSHGGKTVTLLSGAVVAVPASEAPHRIADGR